MWLMTKYGLYSIKNDEEQFHIRARERQDLVNLMTDHGPLQNCIIIETTEADYPYRVIVDQNTLSAVMAHLATTIDYSNFKEKVHDTPSQVRKYAPYSRIWAVLYVALESCRPPYA